MKTNKRGVGPTASTIVFLVITIVFFASMFFFVSRAGSGADLIEKVHSKQIALVIDSLRPGTEVRFDLAELYEAAEKNNYKGLPVIVNTNNNEVTVNVAGGEGNKQKFFTKLEAGSVSLNQEEEVLIVKS